MPTAKSAGWLDKFLIASEWGFGLLAVGLWVGSKTYHPYMNAGIGLWAGTWVARWLRIGRLSRPTPADVPLIGFAVSAVIAAWIAPNQSDALARLALFAGAIGLYYVVANAGGRALLRFCYGFISAASLFGLYFASQHAWIAQPAKFESLQRIGLFLNARVPFLGFHDPHPNVVGAFLAVATGIWLALFAQQLFAWRRSGFARPVEILGLSGLGAVLLFGLLMTQSRAGWLAVAGAPALGGAWRVAGWIARRASLPQWAVFWIGIGFAAGVIAGVLLSQGGVLTTALGTLPGPNSTVNRLDIFGQVWRLAQDTPFTGGGLGSFPGLYSTFVLSVPPLYLTHAHNSYLNVLVEQGWLGAAAYTVCLFLVGWFGLQRLNALGAEDGRLATAGLLGLAVVMLNGLADATLVASRVAPVVLVPAGLAVCGSSLNDRAWKKWQWWLAAAVAVALGVLLMNRPLLAQWHANLGALAQDKVALENWPTGEWDDGSRADQLAPAVQEFEAALAIEPTNHTALVRLGLAAMTRLDFQGAAGLLQNAYDADPGQRVVVKTLGYARLWQGDYSRAASLLATIPEAPDELKIYGWWWLNKRNRSDLAKYAAAMAGRMP